MCDKGDVMNATLLYRIAAVLFVLFAAGHTFGILKFKPPTAEGIAVRDAMNTVQFHLDGRSYSYSRFYEGLGLYVTVYLLFSALLSWHLGNMALLDRGAFGVIGWAFCVVQILAFVLGCIYLPTISAIFSGLIAICLGLAAWMARAPV